MISDAVIIATFFRNSHGIKSTARYFGIPMVRVAKVILRYKKKHNIR
tara:strand:- start:348 stop:488 length:141 start_codon:yes stop_codon:yes gene_type:complete